MAETTASWQAAGDVDLDVEAGAEPTRHAVAPGRAPGDRSRTHGVVLAVALAVLASTTTGLAVAHRAAAVAAHAPPRLEVGYPEVRSLPSADGAVRARVSLPVVNPGAEPLTVTAVDLTERAGPARLEREGLELRPGRRTVVTLETSPRCDAAPTGEDDVAALVVRGPGSQEHTVTAQLASPFGRPALDAQLDGICTGTGRAVEVAVSLLPDRRTLVLRVSNTSGRPTDLSLWAPSASGIVSDPPLPLALPAGEEVLLSLTAAPTCATWSGGLPSMSVDVVSSRPPSPDGVSRSTDRDVPSGWSALLTSWLGGQVARTCDAP